jgi:molecular chaperone GrpE
MNRHNDPHSPHGKHGHGDEAAKPAQPSKFGPPPEAGEKPTESPAPAGRGKPEELLATKTRECEDLIDQLRRLAADFSNFQKRTERRLEEDRRLIVRDLVLDLLPGIDNLERTISAAEKAPDIKVLLDGLRMVHEQLLAGLRKHDVTPIEARGEAFSPEHHEAVMHVPSDAYAEGQVIEELEKGYRHHGRTLRPSRVAVSKGKPEPESKKDDGAGGACNESVDGQA